LPALLARKAMWEGNASVPRRLGTDTIAGTVDYDRFMARSLRASGAEYVSLVDMLCDDHRTCLTLVPGTAMSPMQFDTGHLSREGSLWIVGEMARRISLP
jgi:hypothetical protein